MIDVQTAGADAARGRLVRFRRSAAEPEEAILPVLARRAAELERAVETGAVAPLWRRPAFGRAIDEIRAQLRPLEDRGTLSASFGREAARQPGARRAAAGPLQIAYAVRWLELDPTRPRAISTWADWLPVEPG